MRNSKALVASALILAASTSTVLADCSTITNAATLPDGTWLFRTNGVWRPMSELHSELAKSPLRAVRFAYIASEPTLKAYRRGVLVIKIGIGGPATANGGRVTLAREAYRRPKRDARKSGEQCESYPDFNGGSVSAHSYDRYHDYSERVEAGDQRTIKSFHISYPARGGGCKTSDDDTPDSYFGRRWQSNRSQFSFDKDVVAGGQYSQVLALFGVTPAYAAPRTERRVEMRRYAAGEDGLACILFSADVRPGMFIRINDLERRRFGLFREAEQSWEWPRETAR